MSQKTSPKSRYRVEAGHPCIDVAAKNIERLLDNRDPAPFRDRDLDPSLSEYLVDAADDLGAHKAVRVIFWLAEPCAPAEIEEAYRAHFTDNLARVVRRNDQRKRLGVTALFIAVVLLVVLLSASQLARTAIAGRLGDVVAEGAVILSWIVLWRPVEVLLYDWIPFRRERRLVRMLLDAQVEVRGGPPPAEASRARAADARNADVTAPKP